MFSYKLFYNKCYINNVGLFPTLCLCICCIVVVFVCHWQFLMSMGREDYRETLTEIRFLFFSLPRGMATAVCYCSWQLYFGEPMDYFSFLWHVVRVKVWADCVSHCPSLRNVHMERQTEPLRANRWSRLVVFVLQLLCSLCMSQRASVGFTCHRQLRRWFLNPILFICNHQWNYNWLISCWLIWLAAFFSFFPPVKRSH